MKTTTRLLLILRGILTGLLLSAAVSLQAQTVLPRPDHVVVVIYENHSYNQLIGSMSVPYINALASDSSSALFTDSYAITHPSQPNYIDLYSGCNQGVYLDFLPSGTPWTTANLGRQLLDSGYTWASYSEDLPSVGWDGETSTRYVRRHNPATNWMGTGLNQIPPSTNRPFSDFPSNFDSLPTVCFIAPNLDHDMHDGTLPAGDAWLHDNLDAYVQWAKTHNSLLIFTMDEDDGFIVSSNHITTIFTGQPVQGGQYATTITHYDVLRTIEAMYGLPFICNASTAVTITDCWRGPVAMRPGATPSLPQVFIFPQPARNRLHVETNDPHPANLEILDLQGQRLFSEPMLNGKSEVNVTEFPAGLYLAQVKSRSGTTTRKIIVE